MTTPEDKNDDYRAGPEDKSNAYYGDYYDSDSIGSELPKTRGGWAWFLGVVLAACALVLALSLYAPPAKAVEGVPIPACHFTFDFMVAFYSTPEVAADGVTVRVMTGEELTAFLANVEAAAEAFAGTNPTRGALIFVPAAVNELGVDAFWFDAEVDGCLDHTPNGVNIVGPDPTPSNTALPGSGA